MAERQKLMAEKTYRAKRLAPEQPIVVEGKTIGSSMVYNLATQNVSRSGMLLGSRKFKRIPFTTNTLLELTIDVKSRVLAEPLTCLGKVVRVEDGDKTDGGPAFGIQIIGVDDCLSPGRWAATVEAMENSDPLALPKAA